MFIVSFLISLLQIGQRISLSLCKHVSYEYLYVFPLGNGSQLCLYIKENLKLRAFLK